MGALSLPVAALASGIWRHSTAAHNIEMANNAFELWADNPQSQPKKN
jgi:hypothetical protein